jgi:hypothetical protein
MTKPRRAIGPAMLAIAATLAGLSMLAAHARAAEKEKEPFAIVGIGAGTEWSLRDGSAIIGPSASVEFTPIENWLEIEVGLSSMLGHGQNEWSSDILFKKPFTLSDKVEFMIGVGPEWKHTVGNGTVTDSIAGEVALDFMFWPTKDRKLGWFLEPTYDYDFGPGHEQSFAVTVGLLIPIR